MCRIDIWLAWLSIVLLKCILKPAILVLNWRRSKKLPPIRNKLLHQSATTLAHMIRTRKVTSEEVVNAYIARINEVNPLLNFMMDNRFEAALLEARYVDRVILSGTKTEAEIESETPFLGVPFSIKESIAVKGLKHSAGELRFEGRRAQEDADTVKLMRASGAIPLLVTATPELCMSVETHNKIVGTTNNPYDLRRTPSGSSGGEAAVISSAGSIMGLGSDIAGSLRIPAAFTGIFSHKPTPGLVSHSGHNPTSPDENWYRYFTIGPMARYAEDLPKMLQVLSGKKADQLRLDEKINVRDIKVYYMEDDGGGILTNHMNPEIKAAIQKVITHLQTTYDITAQKVNIREFSNTQDLAGPLILQLNGVTSVHKNDAHPKPWKIILRDLFKFYMCLSENSFPPLFYATLKRMSVWISESKMQRIKEKTTTLRKEFYDMLGEDGVFLYPTFSDTAHFHKEMYFKIFSMNYAMIMNALEVPVTNCPVGLSKNGLPIGIQVAAAPNQDRLTLRVASEIEEAFGGWTEPPSSEKIS